MHLCLLSVFYFVSCYVLMTLIIIRNIHLVFIPISGTEFLKILVISQVVRNKGVFCYS